MSTPPVGTSRLDRRRAARRRVVAIVRAFLARVMVVCVLAGISEPLLADSCSTHSDAVEAQLSLNDTESTDPLGGDATHAVHLCHCAHTHAGIPRHASAVMLPTEPNAGRITAASDDLRSGPPARPLLRPPLTA